MITYSPLLLSSWHGLFLAGLVSLAGGQVGRPGVEMESYHSGSYSTRVEDQVISRYGFVAAAMPRGIMRRALALERPARLACHSHTSNR